MKKIIVFGGLNMDMSIESSRIPNAGESVVGRGFLATPGGKGGNQAVAAARMGADTFMVGKVGNDHNGRKITSELTNHGVSVMSVSLTARAATGVALIVRSQSEYFSIVDPGANQKMSYEEVRSAIHGLGQHQNIFLMSLGVDVEGEDPGCVYVACTSAAERDAVFSATLALRGAGVRTEADYQGRSLKSQFKQADKLGARLCVVLGSDEIAAGVATLRDMRTHEQGRVPMGELAARVVEKLG